LVPRTPCRGEDASWAGVPDDRARRLGGPALARLGKHPLDLALDRVVDREIDVLARCARLRVDDLERAPERVLDDRLLAARPGQRLVELELETGQALVVHARIAEHGRPHALLRILPVLLRIEAEPGNVLVLEGLCQTRVRLALHIDEPARAVGEKWVNLVRVEPEGLLDGDGGGARVFDLLRVGVDRGSPLADGELGP